MAAAVAAFAVLKHEVPKAHSENEHPVSFKMPEKRPNALMTFVYFITGYALSWGVEVFDEDKVKDQAIQEATNVGLLTALLVTVSASPLVSDAPNFYGGHTNSINLHFMLFFMSTFLLAAGTVTSVLQMIVFSSLHGDQLRRFHAKAGILMHLPFLFCVFGTSTLAAAFMYAAYHACTTGWWAVAVGLSGAVMLGFFACVTWFCQLLWDFHNESREKERAEAAKALLTPPPSQPLAADADVEAPPQKFRGSVSYVPPHMMVPQMGGMGDGPRTSVHGAPGASVHGAAFQSMLVHPAPMMAYPGGALSA